MAEIKLRTYQIKGINQIIKKFNCRVLLADDMGLGKTLQVIKVLQRTDKFPAVICCPGYLKFNWLREFEKFAPEIEYRICNGRTVKNFGKFRGVYIINYEILQYWTKFFIDKGIQFYAFDESHFIKNPKAKRSKAALKLTQRCDSVVLMTGTPIENKPIDLFCQIQMINKTIFPSWLKFAKRYNSCYRSQYGWQMGKAKNTKELHNILVSQCMIRRRKDDVLTELPPKIRQVIPVQINNRKEYEFAKANIIQWMKENTELDINKTKKALQMAKIDKLKLITAMGKMDAVCDWIMNESENQKLVVSCFHKSILCMMEERLKNYVVLKSGVSNDERDQCVQRFQNKESVRIFLTTIGVGSTGLNLTAAHTTITTQLGWTPSKHNQFEDRVHRIGQESDRVNALYFIAQDTVEEDIMSLIDGKRNDINNIVDGHGSTGNEILTDLLKRFVK